MGGGDLNAKKAWHPNTLKNQERVWKAEQAAAEEKKRIAELERERHVERERAELNKLAKSNLANSGPADDRLHWMYEKPDKKVQQEEYLLGKAIDKNHDQAGKSSADEIPAVSRRVVGSSMLTVAGDTQVDLARKMREDPLLLVKERERAARAALLNNPVQRARLTQLLRNEQECKKEGKAKKKKKKGKDLDDILAEKLQALSSKKGIDLASLLASDDTSSESSDDKSKKKKQKKEKKRKRKNEDFEEHKHKSKYDSKTNSEKNSSEKRKKGNIEHEKDVIIKKKKSHHTNKPIKTNAKDCHRDSSVDDQSTDDEQLRGPCLISKTTSSSVMGNRYWNNKEYLGNYRQSQGQPSREELQTKDDNNEKGDKHHRDKRNRHKDISSSRDKKYLTDEHKSVKDPGKQRNASGKSWQSKKSSGLSEEEKAAKLAEMVAAGVEREQQRERRVAKQLAEKETESRVTNTSHSRSHNVARQLPDSLESRIHSNRHYIQRDQKHMDENFARR